MVTCFSSPMAAVMEWIWLGTRLTGPEIVSAIVILCGVSVALLPKDNPHIPPARMAAGIVAGLIAAFCQGYGAVLSRKAFEVAGGAGESIDGMTAAYQRTLGGILVTAVCLLVVKRRHVVRRFSGQWRETKEERREKAALWRSAWGWVTVNGVAGPALGVSCFQWALKTTPTGIVLPIVALTPVVIIPFARYLEGERPTRRSLAGVVVAVAGAVALTIVAAGR
jgi:drug/metabolite transporter (DMT)-like permease